MLQRAREKLSLCAMKTGPSPIEVCLRAEISRAEEKRSRVLEKREMMARKAENLVEWLEDVHLQVRKEPHPFGMVAESITRMRQETAERKDSLEQECNRLWRHRKRLECLLEEYRENPPDPLRN